MSISELAVKAILYMSVSEAFKEPLQLIIEPSVNELLYLDIGQSSQGAAG